MDPRDIRLIAIAGPPVLEERKIVSGCRAAVDGGVTAVQLRHKHASASVLLRLTEELLQALPVPVYVNDRADVAWIAGAAGVHVGSDDLAPGQIRSFAPAPFRIGISVGNEHEASRAASQDVDYWSVGSIYTTSTKRDAGTAIGTDGFRRLAGRAREGVPVIAIGGIDVGRAPEILSAGAAGIAVSSALFSTSDIARAARELRSVVDRHLAV
ncbi:MAG: thiamine phosphate synthase [Gemmatimonadales bacterium]